MKIETGAASTKSFISNASADAEKKDEEDANGNRDASENQQRRRIG